MHNVSTAVFKLAPDGRETSDFCVDTGAPTLVIGLKEAHRIFTRLGRKFPRLRLKKIRERFRFANAIFDSLGTLNIPLATPSGIKTLLITLDVVTADVPVLLGLDVMDLHSVTPDFVPNRLVKKHIICKADNGTTQALTVSSIPLIRHAGNIYASIFSPALTYITQSAARQAPPSVCSYFCYETLRVAQEGPSRGPHSGHSQVLERDLGSI